MKKKNLNTLAIDGGESLKDYSYKSKNPNFDEVEVILRDLESNLIQKIKQYKQGAIFGCVAWLTSMPILKALGNCDNVQLIIQKEDFLRPDISKTDNWKKELHKRYNNISCSLGRYEFREPIHYLSICDDPEVDGIRCVGNHNSEKNPAFPRAHHKFLVFCRLDKEYKYYPEAVWTGSFNFTKNATYSFENAMFIKDKSGNNKLIEAYLNEHHQIFALSEKLNWESEWSLPQYRIGT